jgi:hypothetical protein
MTNRFAEKHLVFLKEKCEFARQSFKRLVEKEIKDWKSILFSMEQINSLDKAYLDYQYSIWVREEEILSRKPRILPVECYTDSE